MASATAPVNPTIDAARDRPRWPRIIADLRARPGFVVEVLYDARRTAISRASQIEGRHRDILAHVEERGARSAVVLTATPTAH